MSSNVLAFDDLESGYPFNEAINGLAGQGVFSGYDDGTFRPQNDMNRAEFLKIVLSYKLEEEPDTFAEDCFTDVSANDWFSPYVCYAKTQGYVKGYLDGRFGPAESVNLAEALKIAVEVFEMEKPSIVGEEWFSPYVRTFAGKGYVPSTFGSLSQNVSRGEMAAMLWRYSNNIIDRKSRSAYELEYEECTPLEEDLPYNIDMDRVRATWLEWYNQERRLLGLKEFTYNPQLNRTATIWSEISEDRGYIDHKRPGQTAYYDFWLILDWFEDLGLEFQKVGGSYAVENINWGVYSCDAEDCTDQFISAIKSGYNFFMSEKGQAYSPHYDSIVNPSYDEIGLGVAIDERTGKYYLTVHYATEVISNPPAICD